MFTKYKKRTKLLPALLFTAVLISLAALGLYLAAVYAGPAVYAAELSSAAGPPIEAAVSIGNGGLIFDTVADREMFFYYVAGALGLIFIETVLLLILTVKKRKKERRFVREYHIWRAAQDKAGQEPADKTEGGQDK